MGNGLLISMMAIKDARQRNVANRAISMGKQHTDCPTGTLSSQERLDASPRIVSRNPNWP